MKTQPIYGVSLLWTSGDCFQVLANAPGDSGKSALAYLIDLGPFASQCSDRDASAASRILAVSLVHSSLCCAIDLSTTFSQVETEKLRVGDYVKLRCMVKKYQKFFYAVVIEAPETADFCVRFLTKSGTAYAFGDKEDVGLIAPDPPDFYSWDILKPAEWQNNKVASGQPVVDVVVDPYLSNFLRQHQRDGVAFLYMCVMGLREHGGLGAILADDMGLGKTLQCITLIWTLLKQGPYGGKPVVKKVLIITPGSLVKNWYLEFKKWLGTERLNIYAVSTDKRAEDFVKYNQYPVLILSYEMFVRSYDTIKKVPFDLIICDEGHRLKNTAIKTTSLIMTLPCRRRVVLTGTPVQNDLQEFFSIVEFCNPGILGSSAAFRRVYEEPIIASRQPRASSQEKELGKERASELTRLTQMFVLRRTQEVNNDYLPPKVELVLFCRASELQKVLYQHLLRSKTVRLCLQSRGFQQTQLSGSAHLTIIGALKQLCNHPRLIYNKAVLTEQTALKSKAAASARAEFGGSSRDILGLEEESLAEDSIYSGLLSLFPQAYLTTSSSSSNGGSGRSNSCVTAGDSGKLEVLSAILASIWKHSATDKVVLVSNHTKDVKELDRSVKNRFNWAWLEEKDCNGDFLSDYIRKMPEAGVAWCISCQAKIVYGSTGKKVFHVHAKNSTHGKARRATKCSQSLPAIIAATKKMENCTMESPKTTKTFPYGASQNIQNFFKRTKTSTAEAAQEVPQPIPVSLADRKSHLEGLICTFLVENVLPLSSAPKLLDLAKELSKDPTALNEIKMERTCASYKLIHGVHLVGKKRLLNIMRENKFSLNIDESTTKSSQKRVMNVLVCYFSDELGESVTELYCSIEMTTVNSEKVHNAVKQQLITDGVPFENLIAILTDSAAYMRGCNNGFQEKMKKDAPHIINIDGDVCHHIHNIVKMFSTELDSENFLGRFLDDIFNDFEYTEDKKKVLVKLQNAYIKTVQYLIKKLPIHNKFLEALSALDPVVRGHSVAVAAMMGLKNFFPTINHNDENFDAETLDLLEGFCESQGYTFLRLDGQTPTGQRQELVNRFNKLSMHRIFLLSSKAGGVGLNLIGASRLILYDIDWNPANDLQAMARVWRDGQRKQVFIYRLLTTGSIEEKVYQRQISKQGLSGTIMDHAGKSGASSGVQFSLEDLKDLFSFNESTDCETHAMLACPCDGDPDYVPDPNTMTCRKSPNTRPCQLGGARASGVGSKAQVSNLTMAQLLAWRHTKGELANQKQAWYLEEAGQTLSYVFWNETNIK
ncbi:DNA repair and recombination protein RAD54 [Elysia marginata]|uniref:DNA repair and recombination protein RAD54 n=1 Tax=Elysia marginata TaxID=1093978 RepID=A0AAV4H9J0_9GAST|nr:DNA repair and recombination protein RAD54 [Elysia marginata]